jgi:hypothetical protein
VISIQLTFETLEEARSFFSQPSPQTPRYTSLIQEEAKPKDKRHPLEHITPEQKVEIARLGKEGKTCDEIKEILGIQNGRQINGIITASKHPLLGRGPASFGEIMLEPPGLALAGIPLEVPIKTTKSPKAEVKPAKAQLKSESKSKIPTDKELDELVLNWAESGSTDYEISRRLEHEQPGVNLTPTEIGIKVQGFRKAGLI